MSLARLRAQILVALGAPACSGSNTPPPAEPAPVATTHDAAIDATPVDAEPVDTTPRVMFDRASCAKDTVLATLCGGEDRRCGANATALRVSFDASRIGRVEWVHLEASREELLPDAIATAAYERKLLAAGSRAENYGVPCCYSRCEQLAVSARAERDPVPHAPKGFPAGEYVEGEDCVPKPLNGTRYPAADAPDCPAAVHLRGAMRPFAQQNLTECCYHVVKRKLTPGGRPARVEGEPRFAALAPGDTWHAPTRIDVAPDAALAAKWLAAARMEHASIAAFSTTALRLLALGAPPALIAACQRAALDEIEHAKIAFTLAAAYGGESRAPARFDDAVRVTAMTLRELAIETFVDGCIGEARAAIEAEQEGREAGEPVIAAALAQIAIDEARHATLAWQIVAWCVQQEPAIVDALVALDDGDDALAGEVVRPCLATLAA